MAGTASPGAEGPTFAPPPLPVGWIAQWDGSSKKFYFVELSTGRSQWETPTTPGLVGGGTPAQSVDHPYGVPADGSGEQKAPRIITHADGTQTVQHPDGRMEPIMPGDGSRGLDGASGDRGFGSFAQNALMSQFGGKHGSGGGSGHGGGSNPLGNIASSLLGGGSHGSGSHGGGSSGGGVGGKLIGQVASSLFSGGGSKPQQHQSQPTTNYHGGQQANAPHHSGGLAGGLMGGVANMFGGSHKPQGQNFGYSNSGQAGGYSGTAPPATYQPPGSSGATPSSYQSSTPSYQSSTPNQPAPGQPAHTPYGSQQLPHQQAPNTAPYSSPHAGYGGAAPQQSYNAPPPPSGQPPYQQAPQYGGPTQPQYGGQQHQQQQQQQPQYYPPPPQQQHGQQPYGHYGAPVSGSGQPSYSGGNTHY